MTHQVQFPNLGISVEVNPIAFQVGNFTIYWYGIIIGIGFLLAVLYGFSSCKKMNINKDPCMCCAAASSRRSAR